jgi:hypothetical protein
MYDNDVLPPKSSWNGEARRSNDHDGESRAPFSCDIGSLSSLGWALLADEALKRGDLNRAEELLRVAYSVAEKLPRRWLGSCDMDVAGL